MLARTLHTVTKDAWWPRLTGSGVTRILDNGTTVVLLIPFMMQLKIANSLPQALETMVMASDISNVHSALPKSPTIRPRLLPGVAVKP